MSQRKTWLSKQRKLQINLFISDLHLKQEQPDTIELFLRFLQQQASTADNLYILGDLFDTWVGDDDTATPVPEITTALRELADKGTRIFLQHGNRDFLLGDEFMAATGCALLPDPHCIDLAGIPTLLMHGDLLCTDDTEYQQARIFLRGEAFTQDFLSKDIATRKGIAADYRKRSGEVTSIKTDGIMDVNQETVVTTMRQYGVLRLIHGHTHRPGIHDFDLDGQPAQRIVLSEWHHDHSAALQVTGNSFTIQQIQP
ncbi:UDP-2,3-diacylglucosamine diphosphatase [hydrothermal vent metagenome]|uniref:UDP-2,3-diacylglucosamine diphosphatase n=1 Tax=hydrothermal vent metagenome TaxID=652676 RepID=A0A3B1AQ06_9ZZZZ